MECGWPEVGCETGRIGLPGRLDQYLLDMVVADLKLTIVHVIIREILAERPESGSLGLVCILTRAVAPPVCTAQEPLFGFGKEMISYNPKR